MRQLFITVLSLSISGTLTGLIIMIMHPVTKKLFSSRWNYYVWLLVLVQLMLPLRFSPTLSERLNWQIDLGQMSQHAAGNAAETLPAIILPPANQSENAADLSGSIAASGGKNTPTNETAPDPFFSDAVSVHTPFSAIRILTVAAYLWSLGMAAFLFIKLVKYYRFKSCIKMNVVRINDNRVITMENICCAQLHIENTPALYECPAVSSPMTIGLLKPVIVIPNTFIDNSALSDTDADLTRLQMVLHHELIHVARKDLLYKWLCQLLLCIHWFNPLLCLIDRQIRRDCELSCDEAILAKLTENGRQLYGNILLDTAAFGTDCRENALSTPLLENKKDLKLRLDNILHYRKATRLRLALSACAFIIMLTISACSTVRISMRDTSASEDSQKDSAYDSDDRMESSSRSADSSTVAVNTASRSADSSTADANTEFNRSGDAQKAYDDANLLAGADIQVYMGAYNYMGGDHKVQASHLYLYGSYTLIIAYADRDIDVQIKTAFTATEGKFKIVSITPDGSVVTLNETGEVRRDHQIPWNWSYRRL